MTPYVIDASAALAWIVPSQTTPAALRFAATIEGPAFVAPQIFTWEIENALLALNRRGVMSAGGWKSALETLQLYRIELEPPATDAEVRGLRDVASDLGLTLFDSAYFTLAIERDAILVSRDIRLLDAARRKGVLVADLSPGAMN